MTDDPRLSEAKSMPMQEVVTRLEIAGLVRTGAELVGPCPECGGTDRFGVSLRKGLFQCRICGAKGDQVALVQFVRHVDFRAALDWLCGPAAGLSEAERAERARKSAENAARQARAAEKYRREAVASARAIWNEGLPPEGTPVRAYLARRGFGPDLLPRLPDCLRYHPACRYTVQIGGDWRVIHTGPAMLAVVQGPDGKGTAVHRTWIDLDHPKGKVALAHPETGEALPAKKVQGAKKGGAIRLTHPRTVPAVLVMAEGIETTLSALVADAIPGAGYWAGVDLGNMAGQRMLGQGRKYAGIPDMEDAEAFVPPEGVRRLIYVQDGDSEPRLTRAKLLAGCRRAMASRRGLRAQIVRVPEGRDMNDVLLGMGE